MFVHLLPLLNSILTAAYRSSRYQPSYDSGESRRSPRDQSPGRYNDRDEFRGGSARGGERRRSIPDARANHNAFASNRETFREPIGRDLSRDFAPREPPRGPKGLIDAPTGPRASSYGSDFRGDFGYRGDYRGDRGRGRGRGWRDDSRDRGRELERDYRDRRDDRGPPPPFRDDRGRDRWGREAYRGRRASSPQGRGRSPNYPSRDNRDAPPSIDLDRTRRGSRDGPLSGGSPSADSQSFTRGYGRARGGRGRGRGGYYDDYHRAPGRSRSPDISWGRRTQPSATPPPQVPAFGSTSSNLPVAASHPTSPAALALDNTSGPVPGVAVPKAPRSHDPNVRTGRLRGQFSSVKWVNPNIKVGGQGTEFLKNEPPSGPSMARTSYSPPAKLARDRASTSPKPRIVEPESISPQASHHTVDEGHQQKPEEDAATQNPPRKRKPVTGRRPAKPRKPAFDRILDDGTDSDSAGDLDDGYFEDEIAKLKGQVLKVSDENPLNPRPEPEAVFLKPFIDSTIDDLIVAQDSIDAEPCIAPNIEEQAHPPSISPTSLAPNGRSKGKSRPTTPLAESDENLLANGSTKEVASIIEPLTTLQPPESSIEYQNDSSVPPAAPPNADEYTAPPTNANKPTTNGRARMPMMSDEFAHSDDEMNEAENPEALEAVRKKMRTPSLSSLPVFNVKKWYEDQDFLNTLEADPHVEACVKKHIQETKERRAREQEQARQEWKERYLNYRLFTDFSDDPIAKASRERFEKSRARAAAEAAAPRPSAMPSAGAKPEGARRMGSRFATDHDIERVLRESEQEAKETKEREERVARARTASAKEAKIPDMAWDDEEWDAMQYIDKTHLVPFERSFAVLEYGEPIDNFTEEEAQIFEQSYLEFPKQFSKIAEALPNRDYKACIQHYYLVKHSSNLKDKLKKQPKKKKGRKPTGPKPKSNALMADLGIGRDEGDDGQDGENGERRRPRRAAAPVWPFETPASESEVASPAPTPGRKTAAVPKGDANGDAAPTKRKTKVIREKGTKQSKSNQLLAAAPVASANRRAESPATPSTSEWKNRRESGGTPRFPPQYDGPVANQPNFAPPYVPVERPNPSMTVNFDVMPQSFPTQERHGSAPPVSFDSQQDRRNIQQTSSYWSVPEQTDFPALLRHFGTDWHGIAKFMTSKTHIMVYTTVFQQWLAVPSDSNKSRCVANIQTQVKNYYQRQVDSGKMKEWEDIAKDADAKKQRGEDTGPLPQPTMLPKRRYDIAPGSLQRSGSAMEGIEDIASTNQTPLPHTSPPQPTLSARFPALAQAGPVAQIQPATPTSVLNKHLPPQPIQQPSQNVQQQSRAPRGPAMGYFTTDTPPRPIIQADAVSQRSLMVAQEAQIERQSALRLEREQKELQQQQQAMQRERHLQMKQEPEVTSLHQYEPYTTSSIHSSNVAHPKPEVLKPTPPAPAPAPTELRRTTPIQQFQTRTQQIVRNFLGDNTSSNHEIKSGPSPAAPRPPMSAPPATQEAYSAPPPPQPAPVSAIRQETVRKTSSIMSLLNDEPSDPRPTPPKRVSDVSVSSLQASNTPPPQHPLQASRYAAHSSQPPSQPPKQLPQQMSSQPASQQQQLPPTQHSYAQPTPHSMHQHTASIGHSRSYTPTGFDNRGYAQPSIQQQQQQMYSQPPRQSITSQPPPIRREQSHGEVHGMPGGYARAPAPSQPRLKDSPYSATPPPQAQTIRQPAGSPHELAPPSDRDYYQRPSYMIQQQQSAASSPQLGPTYHAQTQQQPQPGHRHLAFGQSQSHNASPPTQYATQRPLHRSRHNSFDGRFQMATTSAPTPVHQGYVQAPHHPGTPLSMQYQQQHQSQERYPPSQDQEMRMPEEVYYQRQRQREIEEQLRLDDQRRLDEQRRIDDQRRLDEQSRRF